MPSAASDDEQASWFLLAVFCAFYFFDWLLVASDAWPPNSASHYKIYAAALFIVLPLGLLCTWATAFVLRFFMRNNENLVPAILFSHMLFWAWIWSHPAPGLMSMDVLGPVRWTLPLLSVLAGAAALASGVQRRRFWTYLQRLSLAGMPVLSLLLLWHFKTDTVAGYGTLIDFALLALFLSALVYLGRHRPAAALGWPDAVVCVLVFLVTVFTVTVLNYYHQNFYLGPVREVLDGRSLLVDVNCQYGVAVIYFLAAAMKVLGMKPHFTPLTFLLMAWTAGLYVVLYWAMRRIFRSRLLALLCLASIICLSRYGFYVDDNVVFPNIGPLRFGLPILMLAAGYLRRSKGSPRWAWIEYGFLGLSSIWSLETFIYCMSIWGFSLAAETWGEARGVFDFLLRWVWGVVAALAAIAGAFACLYALTYVRAGVWPDWSHYLYFMNLYSGTFPNLPMDLWSPWVLLPGAACLGLLASALRTHERRDLDAGHYFIVGATGAAAAEFSYFIMRSHPTNLSNVAPLFLVLVFYWLDRSWTRPDMGGSARWTALPVALFVLASLHWYCLPTIEKRYSQSVLSWMGDSAVDLLRGKAPAEPTALTQIWAPIPLCGPRVDASLRLIGLYAKDQKQVAIFTPEMEETYALSGKASPYAIGTPIQDLIGPSYGDGPIPVKEGDVMLLYRDKDGGISGPPALQETYAVLLRWVDDIKRHYALVPLEMDPTGIWAVRLAPLGTPAQTATPAKG
jgi:hypothetical protein